eukprot:scaffold22804_cov74-Phaeocystis_antarctica.AAC.5
MCKFSLPDGDARRRFTAHIRLVAAVPALIFLVWFTSVALWYEPASVTTQMRSWAGNEDPCENPLLTHRRFGLTGPPVHVDFNNPGRLGNRLFQAAHAAYDPNPNPNSRA